MGLAPLCSKKMECENEYQINQKKTLVLCRPVQTCVIGQSILPSKNDTSAVKYAYNYQALKKKKANLHI